MKKFSIYLLLAAAVSLASPVAATLHSDSAKAVSGSAQFVAETQPPDPIGKTIAANDLQA